MEEAREIETLGKETEDVEKELKDFKNMAERLKKIESLAGEIQGLDELKNVMEAHLGEIVSAAEDMKLQATHTAELFAENAKKGEQAIETAENLEKKSSLFKKIMPGKKALLVAGILAGGYLYHEGSDTYEKAKLECQETCQGFNNKNISKLKYDQLVNLLYCRDGKDKTKPCASFSGGGTHHGEIKLNECPTDCTDLRGSLRTDTSDPKNDPEKSHINSMLYGSCSLTDNNMRCEYPLILDGSGKDKQSFGIIPLGEGATKDTFDNKFKDPWDGYAAVKAAAVAEIGAGGAVVGAGAAATGIGKVLNNVPVPMGISGVSGVASAAIAKAYIPDSFPGHCLHKLFENYTNEDPNLFSGAFGNSGGLKDNEDYKYIKLCKNASGNSTDLSPGADGKVKKCDLNTGEIKTDGSGTSSEIGSCVAWKKSGDGKCLPTMHSFSKETIKEDIKEDFKYFGLGSGEGDCLSITQEADCNNHTYCYWTKDEDDTGLDKFYFCISDNSLIDVHNGILNNVSITDSNKNHLLINATSNGSVTGSINKDTSPKVVSLNNYSGGTSKKEIDIGDICNNYCSNSLCHEPYISMTLMPGVTHALDAIKTAFLIFVKIIISSLAGIMIYNLSNDYKRLVFLVSMIFIFIILQFSPVSEYFDQTFEPIIVDPLVDQFINSEISENLLIGIFSIIILAICLFVFLSGENANKTAINTMNYMGSE